MLNEIEQKVLELAEGSTGVTPADLIEAGIPRQYLYRLQKKGLLERAARGLYFPVDLAPSEHRTIVEVSKRVPEGVICLLSALQLHGLTTQMPHQVWLAIQRKKWRPKEPHLPIKFVTVSGEAFSSGVETIEIEGALVKVYTPAKTVADCFKFRNKIGLDVALEALRDCLRQRKCSNEELYSFAKACRVWNIMRPYLEALS